MPIICEIWSGYSVDVLAFIFICLIARVVEVDVSFNISDWCDY